MGAAEGNAVLAQFLARFQASVVILSGAAKGTEHAVDTARVTLGRGPGTDLAFDDTAMSREHAAIEFGSDGFQLRDLDSTNGTLLNGGEVKVAEIKHGDRFQVGTHVFQFVVEERDREPATYIISDV
jgi:pSer/pThr/pTyr-binding forkhead associated (FHA) protein